MGMTEGVLSPMQKVEATAVEAARSGLRIFGDGKIDRLLAGFGRWWVNTEFLAFCEVECFM